MNQVRRWGVKTEINKVAAVAVENDRIPATIRENMEQCVPYGFTVSKQAFGTKMQSQTAISKPNGVKPFGEVAPEALSIYN